MVVDLVFKNGQVITVNSTDEVVEAVAIKSNKIVALGSNDEIESLISSTTKVIDLKGKSLLPGFVDAHCHITMYGTSQLSFNCREIDSIEDLIIGLKESAKRTSSGQWIRAVGFNETKVKEKRYPTRWELDDISTEHPIMVTRACGHICIVNSQALEMVGYGKSTPDPKGGEIRRDKQGIPTGVLVEEANMAMSVVASFSKKELEKALEIASKDYIEAGITSLHDAGGMGPENFQILQKSVESGIVKQRVYTMLCSVHEAKTSLGNLLQSGVVTGLGNEKYKIGPAKLFIDGSSSGPTVSTRKPYSSDYENFGILYLTQEELDEALIPAHEQGFQITAHAQGDRAIEMLLNTIEKALELYPRENHRHRIEHAGISMPDLVERMKELNVIPIPNPPFPYEYGDIYMNHYGDRVNYMYPLRDFIDNGVIAAGASDSPVTDYKPLLGIHVAVNRKNQIGEPVGLNQRVTVLEAIRAYTYNGAYASFEEDIKGSIEIGKLADFVIIGGNLLDTPKDQIKDLDVDMTVVDGEIVYEKKSVSELV
ncbi:amidohydrolase [Mesobacillus maritimus]|uniref:amidohydrolase n=1 Tax=Mesobacillus maritimus TaxID=1643336 RepID=UPI00384B2112